MYGAASASDAILIEECSTNESKVRTKEIKRDDFCIQSSEVDLDGATACVRRGGGGGGRGRGVDGLG